VLVGTSNSRAVTAGTSTGWNPRLQVTKTGVNAANIAAYSFSTFTSDLGGGLGIGPDIILARSNNDTEGGQTAITNNMLLGRITFNGSDGTSFQAGALIAAASDGQTWASNDCPTRLVFFTTPDGSSSPTERARITSGGTLGIFNGSGGAGDNTLGLNNPQGSSSSTWFILANHTATNTLNNTGTSAFRVATNGDVTNLNGTYGTISDAKLKQDIVDASSQWNDIKDLRIVKYRLKDEVALNPNHPFYIGLIAQEVEEVSPGLIDNCPDFENVEVENENGSITTERRPTGTVTKSVKSSIIYMKAVKALQEAIERIETLEAKNDALEARIAALEAVPGNE
jgi:hypothetical protein